MRAMPRPNRLPCSRFLHAPGPTRVPDEVLDAMHRQPMDLADPRVMDNVHAVEAGLRWLIGDPAAALYLYASNGHGAWEAVAQNLLAPGQCALVPGTGHFSESWAQQTEALGHRVQRTPWREGRPIDLDALRDAPRDDTAHEIAAVFIVHTDTASGVTSDIDPLRRVIDEAGHRALLVVDAVASLGAAPIAMATQRIDVLIGASQKGLMCPPGLAFVAANEAATAHARANPAPRFYWDWGRRAGEQSYQKFCGTPPLTLLQGVEAGLALLRAEGLPAVHARHRRLAAVVHAAVQAWSREGALDFFCPDPAARSVSVTTIRTAPGVDPDAIRRTAREAFDVSIAGGLGPLAGRAFRIGHLGDLNLPTVFGALAGVEATLTALGVPYGRDGLACAIARAASDTSAGPL